MNQITSHERPGVYSSYEASTLVSASRRGGVVGIAAKSGSEHKNTLYWLSRYEEAVSTFGEGDTLTGLIDRKSVV